VGGRSVYTIGHLVSSFQEGSEFIDAQRRVFLQRGGDHGRYRAVRSYVASEIIQRADVAFEEHGQPKIDAAIAELRAELTVKIGEIDASFAKEIEAFHAAGSNG
jgi:hypothetical protein